MKKGEIIGEWKKAPHSGALSSVAHISLKCSRCSASAGSACKDSTKDNWKYSGKISWKFQKAKLEFRMCWQWFTYIYIALGILSNLEII